MKKFTFLILAALFAASGWTQELITIGDGTTSNYSMLGGYYGYERHAVLYQHSELQNVSVSDIVSAQIPKIALNLSTTPTAATANRKIKIYVKEISAAELDNTMFGDWATLIASATLVYDQTGTSINLVSGWNTFLFSTPYQYHGGNLLFITDTEGNTASGGAPTNTYYTSTANMHWKAKHDTSPLDNSSSNASVIGLDVERPNIQITITNVVMATCPSPTTLTANDISTSSATLTWTPIGTETNWVVEYSTNSSFATVESSQSVSGTPTASLSGLNTNTQYYVRVKAICSLDDESTWVSTNFRTDCGLQSVPFTENFESYTVAEITNIPCWLLGSATFNIINRTGFTGNTLRFSGNLTRIARLPIFEADVNTLELTFKVQKEGTSSGTFDVGYLTNPDNENTFVPVFSDITPDLNVMEWENALSSFPVGVKNIAFRNTATSTAWYYFIDDIDVHVIPTCPKPVSLIANDISSNSTNISWTPTGSETEWIVQYSTSSTFATYTDENVSGTPSVTLSGLNSNTQYYVRVQALCGGGDSSYWTTINFTTECSAYPLPFSEDFSTWTTGSGIWSNLCWTKYTGTDAYSPTTYPYVSTSLDTAMYFYVGGAGTISAAFLPQLDATGLTLTIEFDLAMPSSGRMDVVTATNPQDENTWTVLETISDGTGTTVSDYKHYEEIIIPNYQPGTFIGFKYYNTSTYNSAYLDNINVDLAPACSKPVSFIASNVTSNGALLSWTPSGTETEWLVQYSTSSTFATYTTENVSGTPSATLSGLNSNTQYYARVQASCGGGESSTWAIVNFTTECIAYSLPFSDDFSTWTTGSGIWSNLCWTKYTGTDAYSPTTYPYVSTSLNTAMYFYYGTAGSISAAFLPQLDAAGQNLLMEFDLAMAATYGKMDIVVATNPQDENTWTVLETFNDGTGTAVTNYKHYAVLIPNYQADNYIGFKYYGTSTYYSAYLDNIYIDVAPDCTNPTLTDISVTTTSATVTMTENGSATQWQYVISTSATADPNALTPVTVSEDPFTIEGLDMNTQYYVWVRSYCNATSQSWWISGIFRTACEGIVSVPYFDDFESYIGTTYSTAGPVPGCWYTYAQSGNANYTPHITSSASSYCWPHSGINAMTFTGGSSYGGTNTYAILPSFNIPIDQLMISFWFRQENASSGYGNLTIGYITGSQDNIASYTPLYNVTPTTDLTEIEYMFVEAGVDLSDATYIAFRWNYTGSSYYSACIDDILVDIIPTCLKPAITSISVTSSSATVTLHENGSATQWQYVYSTSATADPNGLTPVMITTNPFTIEGLSPDSQYYIWIRSYCDATDQSYWVAGSFRTACSEYSIPFTEDFSTWTTGSGIWSNPCWTKYTGTDAYSPTTYPYVSTSLNTSMYFYIGTSGTINAAFLPQLDADGLNLAITFDLAMPSSGRMDVVTTTNPQDENTWTALETISDGTGTTVSDYKHYEEIIIPNYQPGTFIGFKYYNTSTYNSAYLDNINVDLAPACPKPALLVLDGTTNTTADLSWTPTGSESQWILQYSTSANFATYTENTYSTTSVTLSGLSPNVNYYARVKAVCGVDEESNWSSTLSFYVGYCVPPPPTSTSYYLSSVTTTDGINNVNYTNSTLNSAGYHFIDQVVSSYPGESLTITLNQNSSTGYFYCWVDLNNDMIFDNATELIFATTTYTSSYTGTITIPSTMLPGNYRVRVACSYLGAITSPCNNSSSNYGDFVDFTLEVIPFADNDAAITAITAPTSGINLTATEPVTATVYNNGSNTITSLGMELTVDGGTPIVETFNTNITQGTSADYTFTATADLSAAGNHTITVRAILPDDEYSSNDSKTIMVTNTVCDVITSFPWTEGFEGSVFPPACWTALQLSGPQHWDRSSAYSHQGYWSAFQVGDLSMLKTALITPPIAIPSDDNYALNFWSYVNYPTFFGYSGVWVSTTSSTNFAAFSELKALTTADVPDPAVWRPINVPLNAYSGQTIYLAFVYQGQYAHEWYIDDVSVKINSGVDNNYLNDVNIWQINGEIFVSVTENSIIRIIDVSGRVLGSFNAAENSTFSTYEPTGLYLIEVRSNSGVSTQKLLVK